MSLVDDLRAVRAELAETKALAEASAKELLTLREQINGERGLSAAINKQTGEITSLRKAAYWVAGLIFSGAIGFAFSVLTVFQPG